MTIFIKKPVKINADVYTLGMEDGLLTIGEAICMGYESKNYKQPECTHFKGIPYIKTLEGKHFISEGDYIITGIMDKKYPCKPDIFKKTYYTQEEYADL